MLRAEKHLRLTLLEAEGDPPAAAFLERALPTDLRATLSLFLAREDLTVKDALRLL